jgi:hypothetical protein
MEQMVDSKQHKLGNPQIVAIALKNTKTPYPAGVAMTAVVAEMSQPKTKVQQFGNTVFVLHMGNDRGGAFKAFNADTAANFMQNSIQFLVWAKRLGMQTLVTDFEDPNIYRMIKLISDRPPMQGMGFESHNLKDGGMRVGINLGQGE